MKKNWLFIVTLGILVGVYGCKKDDDNNPTSAANNNATPSFSALINGSPYIATSTFCELYVDSDMQFRSFVLFGEYQSEIMAVVFLDTILTEVVDSNTVSGSFGFEVQYEDSLSANWYDMVSGNLHISKFDTVTKKTSGTFNAIMIGNFPVDTLVITNGQFTDIDYIFEHSN